jgi:hypothetical protein
MVDSTSIRLPADMVVRLMPMVCQCLWVGWLSLRLGATALHCFWQGTLSLRLPLPCRVHWQPLKLHNTGTMCPHQAFWPGGGWCKKIWTPPLPGLTRLHPLGSPRLNPQTHPASPQSRY